MNFATFADEETWFELIGTGGGTFSLMQAADGFAETAGTELCEGKHLLMKQILKSRRLLARIR